jgi:single-stranded-DNA-specific exonuclease
MPIPRRPGTKRNSRPRAASSPAPTLSGTAPEWLPTPVPDPAATARLERELRLPRTLCALLSVRGYSDPDGAKRFLRPDLSDVHSPHDLEDGDRAARRLQEAIRRDQIIFAHGDYDVDGVSAVALLTRWIRGLGGRIEPFVPHRTRDGYDLGPAGVRAARECGAAVMITADCGIRAHEAVRAASDAGMDVIVTDHHTPGDDLPPAFAVVNPNRPDCRYPNKGLSGTGVAYQVCASLGEMVGADAESICGHLDLVALATVADLVPLDSENRTLVRFGLRALEQTENPGLRALIERAGLSGRRIDAGQVGYRLGPRINAVGRMADAKTALSLLLTDDAARAASLAEELEDLNRLRQDEERRTLAAVLEQLADRFDPAVHFGLVVDGEGWHPGVIGIVASRVVERLHRPTVLVAREGDGGRGSARSIPGFDLFAAVDACAEHLDRFGGHRQAAGMDVTAGRIEAFRDSFNREARRRLDGVQPTPKLRSDLEIRLGDATPELVHFLQYVGPFGIGNPGPVFVARGVRTAGPARVVGQGHLKLQLEQDGTRIWAIGWGLADRIPPESVGAGPIDVAFKLKESSYRGRELVEAHVQDLRPSP